VSRSLTVSIDVKGVVLVFIGILVANGLILPFVSAETIYSDMFFGGMLFGLIVYVSVAITKWAAAGHGIEVSVWEIIKHLIAGIIAVGAYGYLTGSFTGIILTFVTAIVYFIGYYIGHYIVKAVKKKA